MLGYVRAMFAGLALFLAGQVIAQDAVPQSQVTPEAKPESAMETKIGDKDFESPPATLAQMDWLIGQWTGDGIQGAPAMESWLPPSGGTMVGTFVQQTGGGEIMFTEHMYLMEEDGSIALKLKHFNADLTGWEEKDDMLTFRLVAIEPCAAYFNALTLRCDGPDGLVAAVRMQSGGELSFRFERMTKPQRQSRRATEDCDGSTRELDQCFFEVLGRADTRRQEYLDTALRRHNDRPQLIAKIANSSKTFEAYRDAECGAVLEDWIEGTIRGVMTLSCKIDLTDRRTHTIWRNWLTYMDSTPPILTEPKPTQ